MNVKDIKSVDQCQAFCEGVINDFESGIADKEETMQHLREYTFHLHDMFLKNFEFLTGSKVPMDRVI